MKRQFAVIGLGRFGSAVARTLAENGQDVLGIDEDEARVRALADDITLAVQADSMDERALREAGVQNVDVAVVSIGEHIEASIMAVMILKDLGVKQIVAKAVKKRQARVLEHLGVERIIFPERDMGKRLAQSLVRPNLLEHIELSSEYSIVELPAPRAVWGKNLGEADIRASYGLSVIAIKRPGGRPGEEPRWNVNPARSDRIEEGDVLMVLGADSDISAFGALD